jgi:hypothetical protein
VPLESTLTDEQMFEYMREKGVKEGVAIRDERGGVGLVVGVGPSHKRYSREPDKRPGLYVTLRRLSENGRVRQTKVKFNDAMFFTVLDRSA